jgi:hypothetical protein
MGYRDSTRQRKNVAFGEIAEHQRAHAHDSDKASVIARSQAFQICLSV